MANSYQDFDPDFQSGSARAVWQDCPLSYNISHLVSLQEQIR